jgi:Ca2+-binding RTX toxin-like protein
MSTTRNANTNATTTRRSRLARGLLVAGAAAAALGSIAGTASPASAELCIGKRINAQYDGQVLHGTCGNDTFYLYNYAVTVHAGDGHDLIKAGWGGDTVTVYGGNGNDTVANGSDKRVVAFGEKGDDDLEGGSYDDWLYGGEGADDIYGGNGKDVIAGQAGNDTLNSDSYGTLQAAIVDGGAGIDSATGDLAVDIFKSVESKKEGTL